MGGGTALAACAAWPGRTVQAGLGPPAASMIVGVFVVDRSEEPVDPRRLRRGLWLTGLVVAVAAGIGLYVYTRSTGLNSYTCVVVYSRQDKAARHRALELCDRKQRDKAQRAPMASPGPMGYEVTAAMMRDAISRSSWCPTPDDPRCYGPQRIRAATTADVEAAKRALTQVGLAGSVVRVAQPHDPAPDGALIYALRMGDGCVVGYVEVGRGVGEHFVGGLLPNGQCLSS
jgi:hypothetical protein